MNSNLVFDELSHLPEQRGLFYGGQWHEPQEGRYVEVTSPSTGASLGRLADASAVDVERAIAAAREGYKVWRDVAPMERAKILRHVAHLLHKHARELALVDSACGGNPVTEMIGDAANAASQYEFFAGLVTEMKGQSVPTGPGAVNFSVREPLGVVARIIPFNHPFMFCAGKSASALAAGNSVVVKPPEQAPLSSLLFAEIVSDVFPPGVFNVVPGGREVGALLASHRDIAKVALIGSVATGKAVMRAAAETLKPLLLELGGKNALIAFPDADPEQVAAAVISGMNFTWCGQSCGSTSRAFIHESIYDAVVERLPKYASRFVPGLPTQPDTTMGAIVSKAQYSRVLDYIQSGVDQGARLLYGGKKPTSPELQNGNFVEPAVFVDVRQDMRIASEEIFGPVVGVQKWSDERAMLEDVNRVEYGLTCSIWTNDLRVAHRTAAAVEAGYVWVNETSRHILGTPFGGYKQSGMGREECLEELIAFTQEKHIHIKLKN